jgi:outer membrane lipoprotein carrier protein
VAIRAVTGFLAMLLVLVSAREATQAAAPAVAATPDAAAATPAAAARVDRYLSGLSTWSADFKQRIDDEHGKVLRSAAGHLYLQRPGKFRWDYTQPSIQLVVADGKKLWFYDKDLAQANVRDMDATLASTPAMLLSQGGSVGDAFDIAALPSSDGLDWFQLKPKHADTDFQAVRIGFDKGELARMLLADKLNQVTTLSFSSARRNVSLSPDLFSFTPPAGVDVIGRDGT